VVGTAATALGRWALHGGGLLDVVSASLVSLSALDHVGGFDATYVRFVYGAVEMFRLRCCLRL
jgi:hypothetical protein